MSKRTRLFGYSTLILTIILFGIVFIDQVNTTDHEVYTVKSHSKRTENLSAKDFKSSATLTAVGDILIHSLVYNAAKTSNGYDFKPMFSDVKPMLETADITVANQETMIGGHEIGLSTYPSFNSPFEVGDALKDTGVDIVTIANNHTIDRGEKAIQNAINHYNKIGLPYTGAYSSPEDQTVIRTIKKNGITFSFLAYTYGTNGIPVPKDKPYLVNLIDLKIIEKDIKLAKEQSDVVVVSLHFGNEYQRMPSDEQRNIAKTVIGQGADIILGHHPHVLQPMEWIEAEDGHKGFVIYSLGNFLSSQKSIYREIGGILTLTVNKEIQDGATKIEVENPTFQSTYVSRSHRFKIVPLDKASQFGLANAPKMFTDINDHMYKLLPNTKVAQAN
ncbi:CapA family protein [Bacillus suaedaesalsae]|uniref:CapA family protein n=1 Tax=Bacillus suaedaesalsae TaxID=2810349 RepID=A0ABS2DK22_9BACI|nr:CapA family protein [Bacillus suaedaesalsae]MBM6618846.1 CapA family protein [Bacillus suaedaesalsae]